jgi:DNA-binding NarL/FixJ family response regulator
MRLALVDDYEVVLLGLAHMFDGYRDRVEIVQIAPDEPVTADVDIALYDTFAQGEADRHDLEVLIANPHAARVAVYTWSFHSSLIEMALAKGARGYLSKTLPAVQLVEALEAIHRGEVVVSEPPIKARTTVGLDWPGRSEGLSDREAEIIALITQGKSNAEIAALTFLSINSIKTYIRTAYRKIGVTSRTQAVLWGIEHGFKQQHMAMSSWQP